MTVAEALQHAERRLAVAGIRDAARDAERLMGEALRCDLASLLTRGGEPLEAAASRRFHEWIERRSTREPLQHVLGVAHFWRHKLQITGAALVPRPETEILVETALELVADRNAPTLVDVGTGSGCIALALASERPDARVHAIDVSPRALELARQNAQLVGVASQVRFYVGDLLEPVTALRDRIDLIVANPPYVSTAELGTLEPEVRDHEPRVALVPPDGDRFSVYARLVPQAAAALAAGGGLALEVGFGMADEVSRICRAAGLSALRIVPDLQQIPRVVVARR